MIPFVLYFIVPLFFFDASCSDFLAFGFPLIPFHIPLVSC